MGNGSRRKEQALSEPGSVQPTSASSYLKSLASMIYVQFPMSPQGNVPTTAPFVSYYGTICGVLELAYSGSHTTSQLCSVTSCW